MVFKRVKKPKFWQNPKIIEPTPKIKPSTIRKIQFFAFAIFVVVLAAGWLLFFSPYFNVKEIAVEGEVSDETKATIEQLKGRNIFLIGGRKAEKQLQEKQPWIKSIKIVRGIPDTVRIRIIERDAAFSWKTVDKLYLIDNQGVVFKQVGESKLPTIVDNRNLPVKRGDQVVSVDFIAFIESARQFIPLQLGLKVVEMQVDETTFHVAVVGDLGFKIIFDTLRPLQQQLDDFKTFYQQKKDELKEYADLRVEGIVYYK